MRQSLALAWVSFAFLALGASPAHYWLDAGEIAAAGAELGVVHPPGAPGLVPLMHLVGSVPIGSLGFRMSLLSCGLAAVAISFMVAILRRRGAHWSVTWGATVWVLAGLTFVRNARVVEIYAYGAALTMVFLWGFDPAVEEDRRNSRRLLGTAAAVIGVWGFGDLRLALVPIVTAAWLLALRRRERWAAWAPLVVACASLVVLSLPAASAHGPRADWGDPQTLSRTWSHVMAQPIRAAFADEILPSSSSAWALNVSATFGQVVEDLGPFGPVLVVGGVLLWALRPRDRGLLALVAILGAVELFYAAGINPMGVRDRQTGFVLGLLAAIVVGINFQVWSAKLPRGRWALLPLGWMALILPPALSSLGDVQATRSWMPHAWSRAALSELPPGALVLTQSDDLAAGLIAARTLEGARPDVTAVPAQHLHKGGPDLPSDREAQVWAVASHGDDETGRIVDVLTHPPRPPAALVLESAQVGLFSRVPFRPGREAPPLGLSGAPGDASREAIIDRTFVRWLPAIESKQDGVRLSRTIDLTLRGWIGVRAEDPDLLALAESSYLRLLAEVDPDDVSTLISLGAIHDATGRTESAILLSRRALEIDPGRNAALLTLALYLARDPATYAQALGFAERAVALRPQRPENWLRLAQVAQAAGETERARQAHDKANELRAREPSGS